MQCVLILEGNKVDGRYMQFWGQIVGYNDYVDINESDIIMMS